jgi:hypothetical protein
MYLYTCRTSCTYVHVKLHVPMYMSNFMYLCTYMSNFTLRLHVKSASRSNMRPMYVLYSSSWKRCFWGMITFPDSWEEFSPGLWRHHFCRWRHHSCRRCRRCSCFGSLWRLISEGRFLRKTSQDVQNSVCGSLKKWQSLSKKFHFKTTKKMRSYLYVPSLITRNMLCIWVFILPMDSFMQKLIPKYRATYKSSRARTNRL